MLWLVRFFGREAGFSTALLTKALAASVEMTAFEWTRFGEATATMPKAAATADSFASAWLRVLSDECGLLSCG